MLALIQSYVLFADNIYKFSYKQHEYLQGGELIISKSSSNSLPYSFLIKPNWSEAAETIYSWSGMKQNNVRGAAIGSMYIITSYPIVDGLLSLWKENERFFISTIDTNLSMNMVTEVTGNWNPYYPVTAKWIGKTTSGDFGLLLNTSFYFCNLDTKNGISIKHISDNVVSARTMEGKSNQKHKAVYIEYKEGSFLVNFLNTDNSVTFSSRIPISDDIYLLQLDTNAAVISYSKAYPNSQLQIISPSRGVVAESWLEATGERIKIHSIDNVNYIYYLKTDTQKYYLNILKFIGFNETKSEHSFPIPDNLIEPLALSLTDQYIFALFRNGLITFDHKGELHSVDYYPFGESLSDDISIIQYQDYLLLSGKNASIILKREENDFWFINRFFKNFGEILIPFFLLTLLFVVYNAYRNQKTLFSAVVNIPATGAVFIIDKHGRLKKANSDGKKLLGITDNIPMRRMFRFYCEFAHTKPIIELLDKALATRDTFTQKLNIVKGSDMYEWVFNAIPLRNAGGIFKGLVLTGIDITEQLERKRLSNWAQLAHDMQTNLSTIRLNAEQFNLEPGTTNDDRRKKIIHQVGLLIQRVRDVVTVGRSDSVNKELVDAFDICHEVRNEFDEAVFPHVTFTVDVNHYNIVCDKPKLIRAVRNAVENGIKSMQGKPGSITITNWNDNKYAYIGVKDTGGGMDEATKKKMLTPYFTTAKKSGGAGIGTMIMQHVMELHGGEIIVNSTKGEGTQIVFCIPNYAHNKTSKALAERLPNYKNKTND